MSDRAGPVVVFSGGGTGGHLYPALALASALQEVRPDVECLFLGSERGVEARILPERGLPHKLLPVRGLERSRLFANVGVLLEFIGSVGKARRWLREVDPAVVTVTGGFASGPGGLAAVTRGLPIVLQEQNSYPGATTRLLSRWAAQLHLAFPEAKSYLKVGANTAVYESGNPIRDFQPLSKPEARERLNLPEDGSVVFVVGGSQGSQALNELWTGAVEAIERGSLARLEDTRLLWVTGPGHLESVVETLETSLGGIPEWVHVHGYLEDVEAALAAADVATSRAGAMTTSEFLAAGLPSILIPLPTSAEDHQSYNARVLEQAGVSVHLPQDGLTPERLWEAVLGLVENIDRLVEMSTKARRRFRPRAAREIATRIAQLLPPVEA